MNLICTKLENCDDQEGKVDLLLGEFGLAIRDVQIKLIGEQEEGKQLSVTLPHGVAVPDPLDAAVFVAAVLRAVHRFAVAIARQAGIAGPGGEAITPGGSEAPDALWVKMPETVKQ